MDIMQFNYETYRVDNCFIPMGFLLFTIIALIIFIVGYVRYFGDRTSDNRSIKEIAKMILGFVVILFLMLVEIIPLSRGGIYLLFEKENEAIVITGEIEDTFKIPSIGGMKYDVDQNHGNGEGIVIEGTKYYLMTYGDFKKGDTVTIKVLPKSKLILELSSAYGHLEGSSLGGCLNDRI